jgi:hypothetical protein
VKHYPQGFKVKVAVLKQSYLTGSESVPIRQKEDGFIALAGYIFKKPISFVKSQKLYRFGSSSATLYNLFF